MNRSILNPFTLRKRLVIIIAVMLAMFAAVGLIACGDNDIPTGGNGNPPSVEPDSLVFSLDSVVKRTPPGTFLTLEDTFTTFSNRIKVTFDLTTDCDTNISTSFSLDIGNNDSSFIHILFSPVIGKNCIYYADIIPGETQFFTGIMLASNVPHFIKMANLKVFN